MTPATMIRIKEEIGEGNANGTQLIAHTETPAEAFDVGPFTQRPLCFTADIVLARRPPKYCCK